MTAGIQPVNDAGDSLTVDGLVGVEQRDIDGNRALSDGGHAPGVLSMVDLLGGILEQLQIMNAHLAILTGEDITED